jgi:hypothetical protein
VLVMNLEKLLELLFVLVAIWMQLLTSSRAIQRAKRGTLAYQLSAA